MNLEIRLPVTELKQVSIDEHMKKRLLKFLLYDELEPGHFKDIGVIDQHWYKIDIGQIFRCWEERNHTEIVMIFPRPTDRQLAIILLLKELK